MFVPYAKALIYRRKRLAKGAKIPRIEMATRPERANPYFLWKLNKSLGLKRRETLPVVYPQVIAFRAHLTLLTDHRFPLSVLGTIHLGSTIVRHRPIQRREKMHGRHWIDGHRDTDRGIEFDLHSELFVGDELVWEATHAMLSRSPSSPAAKGGVGDPSEDDLPANIDKQTWTVDLLAARRYADASGDYNPIHMAHWAARRFGFKSAIIHGMWCVGKVAEAHAPDYPTSMTITVRFKLPVLLPSTIVHWYWQTTEARQVRIFDAEGHKPHLTGTVKGIRHV